MLGVTHNFTQPQELLRRAADGGDNPASKDYGPYGYHFTWPRLVSLLGFNGQYLDFVAGFYLLGAGCRGYFPNLMRFNSPDGVSPFGRGGINAYAYCLGDPVNLHDPSGHVPIAGGASVLGKGSVSGPKSGAFKSDLPRRGRSQSMGSLINRPMRGDVPEHWDKIGYHGSASSNLPYLETGLNPKRSGTFAGNLLGKGFYVTPDARTAALYAKQHPDPQLYEVYVENFDRLRPGRDYRMHMRWMQEEDFPQWAKSVGVMGTIAPALLEVVIRPQAYFQVEVRMARLRGDVVYPRSHEAPW
ncbi:RHS repeat-associated core domain-containing protein [Pseudomonas rustica]